LIVQVPYKKKSKTHIKLQSQFFQEAKKAGLPNKLLENEGMKLFIPESLISNPE